MIYSTALDLLMQRVWNVSLTKIYIKLKPGNLLIATPYPLCNMNYFSVSISDPTCKESSTLSLICYMISLVPLYLVRETWCLLFNFLDGLRVQLWCIYDIFLTYLGVMLSMLLSIYKLG